MPTSLDEPRSPGAPVVKRTALGQYFIGALVRTEQRGVLKNGEPALKPDGSQRKELVLTLLAMPGTTAPAGIADNVAIPEPGDTVRLILRGGAFGQWIEVRRGHGKLETGDIVEQVTEYGQAYSADGKPIGPKLTTQAQIDAVPRSQSLGIYGQLTLRKPTTAAEAEWAAKADAAHHAAEQTVLDDEEPF